MKLSDVRVGMVLIADGGFTCLGEGRYEVKADHVDHSELYIICREGKHFLSGQIDAEGKLVGLTIAGD
jgi:hypothetical protein